MAEDSEDGEAGEMLSAHTRTYGDKPAYEDYLQTARDGRAATGAGMYVWWFFELTACRGPEQGEGGRIDAHFSRVLVRLEYRNYCGARQDAYKYFYGGREWAGRSGVTTNESLLQPTQKNGCARVLAHVSLGRVEPVR